MDIFCAWCQPPIENASSTICPDCRATYFPETVQRAPSTGLVGRIGRVIVLVHMATFEGFVLAVSALATACLILAWWLA